MTNQPTKKELRAAELLSKIDMLNKCIKDAKDRHYFSQLSDSPYTKKQGDTNLAYEIAAFSGQAEACEVELADLEQSSTPDYQVRNWNPGYPQGVAS